MTHTPSTMRFEDQPESEHVDDRRGDTPPSHGSRFGIGGFPLPIGRGGLGLGGLLLLLAIAWFSGLDPIRLLQGHAVPTQRQSAPRSTGGAGTPASDDARAKFVRQTLAATEECWGTLFREHFGKGYEAPTLVLFRDAVRSACGTAGASVGPFYCPAIGRCTSTCRSSTRWNARSAPKATSRRPT